jgi:hypothetical protein
MLGDMSLIPNKLLQKGPLPQVDETKCDKMEGQSGAIAQFILVKRLPTQVNWFWIQKVLRTTSLCITSGFS